jgi:hypothetical protein
MTPTRIPATTFLHKALQDEGFALPEDTSHVSLEMPPDGMFQLVLHLNCGAERLAILSRALMRLAVEAGYVNPATSHRVVIVCERCGLRREFPEEHAQVIEEAEKQGNPFMHVPCGAVFVRYCLLQSELCSGGHVKTTGMCEAHSGLLDRRSRV